MLPQQKLIEVQVNVLHHTTERLQHETGLVSFDQDLCCNTVISEVFEIIRERFPKLYDNCRFWNVYIKDQLHWKMNFSKDDWIQLLPSDHQTLKQRLAQLKIQEKFVRVMVVGLPIQQIAYTAKAVHLSSLVLQRLGVCTPRLFKPPPLNYGLEVALNLSTFTNIAAVDNCKEIFLRLADQFLTGREGSTMGLVKHHHPMRVDSKESQLELTALCNTLCTTISMFGTGLEDICLRFGKVRCWEELLGSGCSYAEFIKQAEKHIAAQAALEQKSIDELLRYIEGPKPKKKAKKPKKPVKQAKQAKPVEKEPETDQELEQVLRNIEQSWKNTQRVPLDSQVFKAIQSICS